jgi:hypothetical protein
MTTLPNYSQTILFHSRKADILKTALPSVGAHAHSVSATSRLLRAKALELPVSCHQKVGGLRLVLAEALHGSAPATALSGPPQPPVVAHREAAF